MVERKGFYWMLLMVATMFGARMVDTDLRGDSMNYAAISNNVLYSDNPLILTLNGELYMNKPPLFFWANALFIKIFGATPFSVKISTLLAVIVIAYFLYKIAMELFGQENTAVMLPLLFFSTYIVYKNSHMLKLEAFVTSFVIAGVYFVLKYLRTGRGIDMIFAGVFSGLAVFSKGPLGLVLYPVVILFPLISAEHRSLKYYKDVFIAFAISVAIPGWWFVYAMSKTPFFETFFLSQLLDRVGNNSLNITGTSYYQRPVWAYLLYVLKYGGLFLVLFPYGVYRIFKDGKNGPQVRFMFILGAFFLILIHFITTKEHRYLYQFYLFCWFAGAYGLTSMLDKNYTGFIRTVAVVYMLFLMIYPGKLNWASYDALVDTAGVAEKSKLPVVAREEYLNDISDKAAMSFYLKGHLKSPPESGSWLEVVHKKHKIEGGDLLFASRRVKVYLVQDVEEQP